MKKVLLLFVIFVCTNVLFGATGDLSGIRIFIDPGHGGHESDDRGMPSPPWDSSIRFWESEGNLTKAFYLKHECQ